MPEYIKSILLAISLLIKNILIFILPFIIFSFSFYSFSQLKTNAVLFTLLLLAMMCSSNFTAVISAYYFANIASNFTLFVVGAKITGTNAELMPLFFVELPALCSNILGLSLGAGLGIYASAKQNHRLLKIAKKCSLFANQFLQNIFIPIVPIFILGFVLKLQHEKTLALLFGNFLPLLLVVLIIYFIYFGIAYFIFHNFDIRRALKSISNIIPAAIVGFSTMSSAASMPILSSCALKNSKDASLTQTIIPSIVNTHMLGDALAIPLIALSLFLGEYHHLPDIESYFFFACGYVLAKFAAAGVPGGTIIIMIPVLEAYLQFTPEMSGLILMIYILLDSFCTMGNVFGNGLFAIMFERVWLKIK